MCSTANATAAVEIYHSASGMRRMNTRTRPACCTFLRHAAVRRVEAVFTYGRRGGPGSGAPRRQVAPPRLCPSPCRSMRSNNFGNASVDFDYLMPQHVLGVSPSSGPELGGTLVHLSGIYLSNGSHYACSFGASNVPGSYLPTLGKIACVAPGGLSGSSFAVEVSLNAQQFTSDGVVYGYYGTPSVSGFAPRAGPREGETLVTVSGSGFGGGSDYRCRFDECGACATEWSCGACVVNATFEGGSLKCAAPPLSGWSAGSLRTVSLGVSLNSQQYTVSNASWLSYSFYEVPVLLDVSPSLGPLEGGTRLVVNGSALGGEGSHLLLRFNSTLINGTYHASFDRSGAVMCTALASATPGAVSIEVSLNGAQFGPSAIEYRYYVAPRVSIVVPSVGPTAGGSVVLVFGSGMASGASGGPQYRCRFGNSTVTASLVGEALRCLSPAHATASLPVEISLNNQNFTSDGFSFFVYTPPVLSTVTPHTGPRAGTATIVVAAANLRRELHYRCAFNASLSVAADYHPAEGTLSCTPPESGAEPLLISVGGSDGPQMHMPTNYTTYADPSVCSLSHAVGPLHGGTRISVLGSGFPSTGVTRCLVGDADSAGTLMGESVVKCTSPTLHAAGVRSAVSHDFSQVEPTHSWTQT